MTGAQHDPGLLGAYALDALDGPARAEFEAHLRTCDPCRTELADLKAVTDMLHELPPEALLSGPPGADDVLERALGEVRVAARTEVRRRRGFALAAGVVALAGALAGGIAIGHGGTPAPVALPSPPAATAEPLPPNTRSGTTVDPVTKVRLSAQVLPRTGWVQVYTSIIGIPAGEDCRIVVVGRDGRREIAGGWIVSARGEKDGATLSGTAVVAPADVVAVEIQNVAGKTFVSLRF